MDRLARLMHYAQLKYGDTPQTTARVMQAVREGTENMLMTPAQRRRDKQKTHMPPGTHRQSQRARRRAQEAARAAQAAP